MTPLAARLRRCGFQPSRFGYPSVSASPADNAERLQRFLETIAAPTVHFVAHSLGGLVVLRLFQEFPDQRPGRIVLLGTPLQGSRNAARLARVGIGRRLLGHSIDQGLLGDGPPWQGQRPVGVIAGTIDVGLGLLVAGRMAGDGTVALAETRGPGITDWTAVPATHTGLLLSAAAARQVCRFLRRGRFGRTGPES